MPLRVRFVMVDPPHDHAEITAALAPLVDAGFTVTVALPSEDAYLGWRVLLDQPGLHTSFRMKVGAKPEEWAEAARRALRPA